jgi:predicted DNA-binding protein (UPF0251 family)/predicted Fe-Mo cluster-binding NifX family protein
MAREPKCRRVESIPKVTFFKPAGIPLSSLEEVVVKLEELEAIRLKDLLGLEQEEGAERMGVSRPTFQRILIEGRAKVAAALIEGLAIRIEGGNYCLGQGQCRKAEHSQKRRNDCFYLEDKAEDLSEIETTGTKIALCAAGDSPLASIDGYFGRCAYFMLWDEEQGSFEAFSNSGPELNQGAGTGTAQELLRRGVGVLICNRIGPKALTVLQRAGVKVYGAGKSLDIKMALKHYQAGELQLIEAANNIMP